jgi:hypothetical protein
LRKTHIKERLPWVVCTLVALRLASKLCISTARVR